MDAQTDLNEQTAFAVGHVSSWLGIYAESCQVLRSELTLRVASVLLAEAGGTPHRTTHSVPTLPRRTAKRSQAVEPLALAGNSHHDTPETSHTQAVKKKPRKRISDAGRKRISDAAKNRWARYTPRQKRITLNRMTAGRK